VSSFARKINYSENRVQSTSGLKILDYTGGFFHQNRPSDWDNRLGAELNHLCALEENWDGYGSDCVSFESAMAALSFLNSLQTAMSNSSPDIQSLMPSAPMLVPVSGGALQAEWHINQCYIELFFDHKETVSGEFYSHDYTQVSSRDFTREGNKVNISPVVNWFKLARDFANDATTAA